MTPGEVEPELIPHLPHGWFTFHCMFCTKPVGVMTDQRKDLAMYLCQLSGPGHTIRVSAPAHRDCLMGCEPKMRAGIQRRALQHMLAEKAVQLN